MTLLLSCPDSYYFPSNLTCCDSFAAAAASPVSMEATLVPSRTGLSCRGTEGPTRAARKAGAGETQAVWAQMSSTATLGSLLSRKSQGCHSLCSSFLPRMCTKEVLTASTQSQWFGKKLPTKI